MRYAISSASVQVSQVTGWDEPDWASASYETRAAPLPTHDRLLTQPSRGGPVTRVRIRPTMLGRPQ
jgi:hypothetical protein